MTQKFTPEERKYIKEVIRHLPMDRCVITKDWNNAGMCFINMSRRKPNGQFHVASFLVDLYLLGVKEAYLGINMDPIECVPFWKKIESMGAEDIDPVLAFNIIFGAVEFAEQFGFAPHPDFELAQHFLPYADEIEYIEVAFGLNGEPFYIEGPSDNKAKILVQLNKVKGGRRE